MRGYTVEAAFVMPVGLLAMLSLIFLSFYLHDVQILQAGLHELADRAVAEGWEKEQLGEELAQKTERMRLLFLKVEGTEVLGDGGWWRDGTGGSTLSVDLYFPIPGYAGLFFQNVVRDGRMEVAVGGIHPEEFARKSEAIGEVLE